MLFLNVSFPSLWSRVPENHICPECKEIYKLAGRLTIAPPNGLFSKIWANFRSLFTDSKLVTAMKLKGKLENLPPSCEQAMKVGKAALRKFYGISEDVDPLAFNDSQVFEVLNDSHKSASPLVMAPSPDEELDDSHKCAAPLVMASSPDEARTSLMYFFEGQAGINTEIVKILMTKIIPGEALSSFHFDEKDGSFVIELTSGYSGVVKNEGERGKKTNGTRMNLNQCITGRFDKDTQVIQFKSPGISMIASPFFKSVSGTITEIEVRDMGNALHLGANMTSFPYLPILGLSGNLEELTRRFQNVDWKPV